ncbi:MAG TPA: SPFH domain-containing protein [Steroidobacteraceae bacterium]|nr:SPFH domain-containing protein [Steroidobacteraceae bacterium]
MSEHFAAFRGFLQRALIEPLGRLMGAMRRAIRLLGTAVLRLRVRLVIAALLAAVAYVLYLNPPVAGVHHSEVLVRSNLLDGTSRAYDAGSVLLIPGIHQVRRYATRDQVYRLAEGARATGPAPFQSNEGLSIGVDLTVRWAIDRARIAQMSKEYPDDLNDDLVRPAVQGIVYPLLARHSVREIFSSQREQIQQEIAIELKPKLATLGLVLRGVDMGQVDLPAEYRAQMQKLLAEELETEKIRYTLQLKEAQVQETQLTAEADKVRRQKAAEAAGAEQVIAARAQEETMKHVLPFKQKQIEQRQLEAEAEKLARIRTAEGAAEARRIEAKAEADSRQKLADAEAYRLETVGKSNAGQMEREGALIARYPLLIQKTLADKLSDKVQVIIAPTPAPGQFLGSNLVGLDAARGAAATSIPVSTAGAGP